MAQLSDDAADGDDMAMSARTRSKRVDAAQKLLPEAKIISYSEAVAGPNPKQVTIGMAAVAVAVTLGIFVATGLFVLPGLLVFIIVKNAINPGRGLVVDAYGLAVVKRSMLTGKPTESVGRIPRDHVPVFETHGDYIMVPVSEAIWLSKREMIELESGLRTSLETVKA